MGPLSFLKCPLCKAQFSPLDEISQTKSDQWFSHDRLDWRSLDAILPPPAYYYITAAFQFWFFKWISWGVVLFFLQMQMCWLHSKPTEWKFLYFFLKASNMILRQAPRGDFCLFVCLSKQGLLSSSNYIELCSWLWTLSFSNSIIINIISGVTLPTTTNGTQRWFLLWEMSLCSGKSILLIGNHQSLCSDCDLTRRCVALHDAGGAWVGKSLDVADLTVTTQWRL